MPFIDVIRYKHSLKEMALDIPAQVCITRDNVQVQVDGVLYLKVLNPERASYGISDYLFAISQLAQTTLRSEVGKIDLDRTFEERTNINIVGRRRARQGDRAVGRQGAALRDQEHHAAADILAAMEKQMRAEREKRAVILTSEGQRDAAINTAEGDKQQMIKASEARRQQQINEAEGQASAILAVATATAEGHQARGRSDAGARRRRGDSAEVAEQYIAEFGKVINNADTIILPSNLADVASMITTAMQVIGQTAKQRRGHDRQAGPGEERRGRPERFPERPEQQAGRQRARCPSTALYQPNAVPCGAPPAPGRPSAPSRSPPPAAKYTP